MLADAILQPSSGNLTSGIEPDESIKAVITFIKQHFRTFALKNKGTTTLNEKGLTQKLCIFLNQNARHQPFFFHSEFMEDELDGTSPQVDLGTISYPNEIKTQDRDYKSDDSFFSIEAKRLPTPGQNREREYVIGHETSSGGIERFKKGLHGSRLKYAAIIGYIQKENFNHWFVTVNSWIGSLAKSNTEGLWFETDKVKWVANNDDICAELSSDNVRAMENHERDTIQIYHFWINLSEDPSKTVRLPKNKS